MVNITIYIEGKQSQNSAVSTFDNSIVFRENFHKLFSQKISPAEFNLSIIYFGTITKTRKMLEHIEAQGINAALLIDLDAPKERKDERLNFYKPLDITKIFFMIQEMEAWILSQTDKIEKFGKEKGLIRKRIGEDIKDNSLIKNCHPERINKPSQKLDTILRQYFDVVKIKGNKERKTGKRYVKAKDGPALIGLLELPLIVRDFDEAKSLVDYIKK